MEVDQIVKEFRQELEKIKKEYKRELSEIRGHRPSLSLVENIEIELYGKKSPLKSWGNLTIDQEGNIFFYPWDPSYLDNIERALMIANIGASIKTEKDFLVLSFPPLSQEMREKLLRLVREKQEKNREKARKTREEFLRTILRAFEEKEITEDDKFWGKEELDKAISEFNEELQQLTLAKEEEIKS